MSPGNTIIIGAGPAGMGSAYTLAKKGVSPLVIEKENTVGGLCRTIDFDGYLFDIGGHRFLTNSEEINTLWQEAMQGKLLRVRRLSRIYYRKRYFNYPLSFFNTFWNLGPVESLMCIASYLRCKSSQTEDDNTFEGWIINRFGRRLYEIFFNSYTVKVWDVACQDISSDWAKQRISGLSLKVAIQRAFSMRVNNAARTLYEEFLYPRKGPGEFYGYLKEALCGLGAKFAFAQAVTGIRHNNGEIVSVVLRDSRNGKRQELPLDYLFSSMPLTVLVQSLVPGPPREVIEAARNLNFRSFLVANIILDKENIFPDQWLYIHCPQVKLSRIQNYKNWSREMVCDPKKTSLGLEYFCREGDSLWRMNDVDLIDFALNELEKIGIVSRRHLINGFIVRCPYAYPVYSLDYRRHIAIIRNYLNRFSNLQVIGRQGLFRYCNSDFALLTGIHGAKKALGEPVFSPWELCDVQCE